ncbi:uncharacterized protein LOC112045190 [Bicyclus anynana]|uniref:Uncharacterized protein LOC112045190 n=1 Tax=Bicyclus anynana TaxID=110368 RepID=A0ABM3LXV6_BICAN|nr:uncharacterized protein LOC112045190 [Bicyclus anynana]
MVEGNDSESADDYEGNDADDATADDYIREDQESTADEVFFTLLPSLLKKKLKSQSVNCVCSTQAQQKSGRHEEIVRESREQGDSRDFEGASDQQSFQNKYRYKTAQEKSGRQEEMVRESREQGDSGYFGGSSDQHSSQDKYRYKTFSEDNLGSHAESVERSRPEQTDLNAENEKDYPAEKQQLIRNPQHIDANNIHLNELYSHSNVNQKKLPQSDLSLSERSVNTNPDIQYGELLFKMKTAQASRQQNNLVDEAGIPSRLIKQYNLMHSKNSEQENENTFNYERDRRHAPNIKDTDSTRSPNDKEETNLTNENSENAILRNIKKISEQDLEELLNSLPEDKKALLKKIMDKREITKKAGAIDENSYLEGGQADTSKLEGGYSVYFTESSMTSDTSETSKQPESSDSISSKIPDSESGSKESGSKSEIITNTEIKNDEPAIEKESEITETGSKNDVNINSSSEEFCKTENKRETNNKELTNEKISLEDSKIQEYQLEAKDSNDYLGNQDDLIEDSRIFSENENWANEPQESNERAKKREISQNDPLVLQECVKSLGESFPAANSYEDNILESEMAPLIRVKRTEKEHQKSKHDSLPTSNDNAHFSPGVEGEDCESEEKSELHDYGVFNRASNSVRKYQGGKSNTDSLLGSSDIACHLSQFSKRNLQLHPPVVSETQEKDKTSLGSDTDTVLSGIEGVDENLMYSSGLLGKRSLESSDIKSDKTNINRSGRTAGPINVDDVSDNSINVCQYQNDEAFGPVALNSEGDLSRYKRVRQVEQDSQK